METFTSLSALARKSLFHGRKIVAIQWYVPLSSWLGIEVVCFLLTIEWNRRKIDFPCNTNDLPRFTFWMQINITRPKYSWFSKMLRNHVPPDIGTKTKWTQRMEQTKGSGKMAHNSIFLKEIRWVAAFKTENLNECWFLAMKLWNKEKHTHTRAREIRIYWVLAQLKGTFLSNTIDQFLCVFILRS